jgi:Asp-tRNA(Asn)/Glu-tRNA(Gln) amidotransferase A subunit family amidase
MNNDLLALDAVGQAEAIRAGEVSALELTDAHLERIDRVNETLRAFVALDVEGARAAARAVDAGEVGGSLAGVTFSIKDVDDVAGLPTTHSCAPLADNVADTDGPVVHRFRAGGLVILGKTNVPENCTSFTTSRLHGVCRNPWDPTRTPGGSSGGAGAAVAAGLCAAAHGTDGAGSVRVPAAFCGLVGLKVTRGLVHFGPLEGSAYFGTSGPGVLSRSVRDAAVLLDLLAPPGPWTPARPRPFADEVGQEVGGLRIGLCPAAPWGELDEETAAAAVAAGQTLESLGHHVEEVRPAWEVLFMTLGGPMEVPGIAGRVALADAPRLEPRNQPLLQRLAALTVVEHAQWVESVRAATKEFVRLWDDIDVLVTSTAGWLPPDAEWAPWDLTDEEHRAHFAQFPMPAQPFNITGQPAISVPMAWSAQGLPIGIQLAGRHLEEAGLLRLAAQVEQACPWADRQRRTIEAW